MFPQSFLAKANGKVVSIKPDGNCFYRDISYQLFGTEEDSKICSVISWMERFNKDLFSTFLIPAGNMEEVRIHVCSYSRYLGYSS